MDAGGPNLEARNNLAQEAEFLRPALERYFQQRVPQRAEAEDLVQEVFSRLVARESIEPVQHLPSYIFQVAASVLADRARRRGVRRSEAHVVFDPEQHGGLDFDGERVLVGKQRLLQAAQALSLLPERTRTIFVLHRLEGHRYREIAKQLGLSVSAVEKHMVRAVQHLSRSLEDAA